MFIYIIRNSVNDKVYIGKCVRSVSSRWAKHLKALSGGVQCAIYSAMRKYGVDKFSISVLSEHLSKEELIEAEKVAISHHKSLAPNGYNMTPGGEGGGMLGHKHSPETIEKMRKKRNSPATIEKMRIAQRLRSQDGMVAQKMQEGLKRKRDSGWKSSTAGLHTPEAIAKMRKSKTGRPAWNKGVRMPSLIGNQHAKGYRHTEEAKMKIGLAALGNKYAAHSVPGVAGAN